MREALLFLIIICEVIIALTKGIQVDESSLSIMTTLVVVMLVAFTVSAILRNFKNMGMTRNYAVSGVIGFAVGIVYLAWVRAHLGGMLSWIETYGLYILLLLIFLSAVVLYLKGPSKKEEKSVAVEPVAPEKPASPPESGPEPEKPNDEGQAI